MKRKLTPEELHLWKSQLKDVNPLSKKEKVCEDLPSHSPKKIQIQHPQPPPLKRKGGTSIPLTPLQEFGRKELRHLKIDGRLDMHGMTLDEGYMALEKFLIRAQEKGFKIVLIITGKGSLNSENTLRRQLPRWVKETALRSLVSSFHAPAKVQDGGTGACYIGLRKRSKLP